MSRDYQCTEERFLSDVSNHVMKVINDDGVNRHLRFSSGGYAYRFDLITWDGQLLITGDCGSYLFQRCEDMFTFFRMDRSDFNNLKGCKLQINAGYWGEKLKAIATTGGYRKFSEDKAREVILDHVKNCFDGKVKRALLREIESSVLSHISDGRPTDIYDSLNEFEGECGFKFRDAWEWFGSCEDYTFGYIWCLYAIAWGIMQYDNSKAVQS